MDIEVGCAICTSGDILLSERVQSRVQDVWANWGKPGRDEDLEDEVEDEDEVRELFLFRVLALLLLRLLWRLLLLWLLLLPLMGIRGVWCG